MDVSYWKGYIKQKGLCPFAYLLLRKIVSRFVSIRFAECGQLMLGNDYQISGHKYISIGKLSAGVRFRMEAIAYFFEHEFSPEIHIGDNVSFGNDIHIGCVSKMMIGDNVLCGSNIVILDHDHGCYSHGSNIHSSPNEPPAGRRLASAPIVIGNNVHIGEYVVVLKGVEIGAGSVIGAGAVVTRSIPANCLAVGNPARVIKKFDFNKGQWMNVTNEWLEQCIEGKGRG